MKNLRNFLWLFLLIFSITMSFIFFITQSSISSDYKDISITSPSPTLNEDDAYFKSTLSCDEDERGDINCDGQISPADALIVFSYYINNEPYASNIDVTMDGKITPEDALCIFLKYLDQPSCLDLPLGEESNNSLAILNTSILSVGGGEGYQNIIKKEEFLEGIILKRNFFLVETKAELLNALENAKSLQRLKNQEDNNIIVFVGNDVEIDLTGDWNIPLYSNITLASGRGDYSLGGLIYTDELDTSPLFDVRGDNVRVTGIRLRGPDPEITQEEEDASTSIGIRCIDFNNLTVDNCELYAWSNSAIYLKDSSETCINNNFIHHNQRESESYGLGYGVVLNHKSHANIEWNVFD